ncbi:MAG: ATP-dependent Clp protease ATP-binding subunit [Cyanobacteria bacterium P01_C01_bin.89]
MFEYFTDRTIQIILFAQEESRRLGHRLVGSEQLLLGVIGEQKSPAAQLLAEVGVTLEKARKQVESMIGRGAGNVPPEIPFTPKVKQILERSLEESRQHGQSYVTPEHLLLSLVRDQDNSAAKVIQAFDVNLEELRVALIRKLGESVPVAAGEDRGGRRSPRNKKGKSSSLLAEFGENLTQKAKDGKLDPVVGREREIERVVQILGRRTKNNPMLVGEPGVGKTAIAEGLALRIVAGEVPEGIENREVVALDLGLLVAGTQYRGAFEERLTQIVEEVREAGNVVLFIDEVHNLLGAGTMQGGLTAANILKPALARGELQCMGATTLEEFRKYIEKDAALERRFQSVKIGEPSVPEAMEILFGLRRTYEEFHKVSISDEAVEAAVKLADRYISDRFLPDKAIDLIDEAGSRVHLANNPAVPELRSLKKELAIVLNDKDAAVEKQDFDVARSLRDRELALQEKITEIKAANGASTDDVPTVGEEDIANIVSSWTGVPVTKLTDSESAMLVHLEERLHERLIGQEEAVSAVARSLRRARSGLRDPERPLASFIFLGPTGVGKTELSKALAEFMFGDSDALIRVDMSEYMDPQSMSKMIGSPPGFVGYDDGGQLSEQVRRRPYSVVLFDEIEKAHPDIFNIMLQVLDDGRLTDSQGRTVSFKNTLIIMTSNLGSKAIEKGGQGVGFEVETGDDAQFERMRERVQDELKNFFRPEFLNRIDEIVVFRQLTQPQVRKIADLMVQQVSTYLADREITLVASDRFKDKVAIEGYDPAYGARPLRRKVTQLLEDALAEALLAGDIKQGDHVLVDTDEDDKVILKPEEAGVPAKIPAAV